MSIEIEAGLQADVEAVLSEVENFPLVENDGEPLESYWHRSCINLLITSILSWFHDREDFYVGGNMFVYYSLAQARNRDYRGPDFYFVDHVNLHPQRRFWVSWLEGGRLPDVIIELLSPTTAREDRTTKRDLYEQTFHTKNYYCYDPDTRQLEGWELVNWRYVPLQPNERGWLWCSALNLWVGTWQGEYLRANTTWLRFYDENGRVVEVREEIAEQLAAEEHRRAEDLARQVDDERRRAEDLARQVDDERQRTNDERRRADAAEAELARLRAALGQQTKPEETGGAPS